MEDNGLLVCVLLSMLYWMFCRDCCQSNLPHEFPVVAIPLGGHFPGHRLPVSSKENRKQGKVYPHRSDHHRCVHGISCSWGYQKALEQLIFWHIYHNRPSLLNYVLALLSFRCRNRYPHPNHSRNSRGRKVRVHTDQFPATCLHLGQQRVCLLHRPSLHQYCPSHWCLYASATLLDTAQGMFVIKLKEKVCLQNTRLLSA